MDLGITICKCWDSVYYKHGKKIIKLDLVNVKHSCVVVLVGILIAGSS